MAIGMSVMFCALGMSKWGIVNITVRLYTLHSRHSVEGAMDSVIGVLVMDR